MHYRRWGVVELWEGGRYRTGPPPSRVTPATCIEIWLDWKLVGSHRNRAEALAHVATLLRDAPTSLHDLVEYLRI